MGSIGASIRRAFGPYERQVSEIYRRCFIDLEDLAGCIRDWTAPTSILEIGCGEGALAERLVRDFPDAHYTGVDVIPHLGRMFDGPQSRVEFRQIPAEELAQECPNAFDLVVINDVLHHVPDSLRVGILEAAKDLLCDGGTLVFKDWVRRFTPIHLACYVADVYIGGDRNVRYMALSEQRRLLENCFGSDNLIEERSIAPWSQNLAILVRKTRNA